MRRLSDETRVNVVDQITESLTADSPSENLFDQLPLRQLVVFVVRAHHRPLNELADLLGLSRETVHHDLRSAIRTLSEQGVSAPERPERMPGRPYRCADHKGDCPARCSHLRRWLAVVLAKPATVK